VTERTRPCVHPAFERYIVVRTSGRWRAQHFKARAGQVQCLGNLWPHGTNPVPLRKLESVFDRLLVPSISPCPIGKLLAETDPKSADNLKAALAMRVEDLPNAEIRRALLDEAKFTTSVDTISAHRKGDCRCTKI